MNEPTNTKPSRTTFHYRLNEMVDVLRTEIIQGKHRPGDYLPAETALAEIFQLSKNSVRKGLDILVKETLIEKVPKVGTRICHGLNKGAGVTVRFGYYSSLAREANIHKLTEDFHLKHPHIRVELVPYEYLNFNEVVPNYFAQGLLDAATINYNNFLHSIEENLQHIFEPLEKSKDSYSFLERAFEYDGELLVKPFVTSPVILCYNPQIFHEKGVPEPDSSWTWEDVIHYGGQLSDEESQYGFYFHVQSDNRWPIFLLQNGMKFNPEHDSSNVANGDFENEAFWSGLEECASLINDRHLFPPYLSERDSDTERLFLEGKVAMILTTYFGLNYFRDTDLEYEISSLPSSNQARTLSLNIGLAVNKQSQAKAAALMFVRYLASHEAQQSIRRHTLSIPSHKMAGNWKGEESFYRPSRFNMYQDIIPTYAHISELGLPFNEIERLRNDLKLYWSMMETKEQLRSRLKERG